MMMLIGLGIYSLLIGVLLIWALYIGKLKYQESQGLPNGIQRREEIKRLEQRKAQMEDRNMEQTLKEFRKDRGLPVRVLAKELSVTPTTIFNWETGKTTPNEEVKKLFRKTYPGYNVIEMMEGEEIVALGKEEKYSVTVTAAGKSETGQAKGKTIAHVILDPEGKFKYVCATKESARNLLVEIACELGWTVIDREVL